MRISREITCGLSYHDVISCAGMSQKEAAAKLGVDYCHFCQVVKRQGLSHWFSFTRPHRITPEEIAQVASEGYTQQDAAFLLGMNAKYFSGLVNKWGLRGLFPPAGKAQWISRRGYCN